MSRPLSVLLLEDSDDDAGLMARALRADGIDFTMQRVQTREDFIAALEQEPPDLILSDYHLPAFDGRAALQLAARLLPEAPLIIVSGALPDMAAAELLSEGAVDYILKDRLSRLGPAVRRAMAAVADRRSRLAADQALRESELRYRRLFESAQEGLVILQQGSAIVVDVNPFAADLLGLDRAQLIGRPLLDAGLFVDRQVAENALLSVGVREETGGYVAMRGGAGQAILAELTASAYDVDGARFILCSLRDITERVRASDGMRNALRTLGALRNCSQALLRATDEERLLQEICRIVVDDCGYVLACVDYAQNDPAKTIAHVALAGDAHGYRELAMTWDDNTAGQSPAARAIRSALPQVVRNVQADPDYALWREHAQHAGYRSVLALPLGAQDRILGSLSVFELEADGFDEEELKMLAELADILSFGVAQLRLRAGAPPA